MTDASDPEASDSDASEIEGSDPDAPESEDFEDGHAGTGLGDLLGYIAREIVDDPDAVEVTETPDDRGVLLTLRVAQDDMGKVIGRGGRTARAIRAVVKAAALRAGIHHTHVDIAD